jgi:hypothetical protein
MLLGKVLTIEREREMYTNIEGNSIPKTAPPPPQFL